MGPTGIELTHGQRADLERLAAEVLRWNRAHNLTGHHDPASVWADLIEDSLVLAPLVLGPTLLDIGSGAGFPGLALAVALPGLVVTLLEPRAKRIIFQRHAARLLGLGDRMTSVESRAGVWPGPEGGFATVTLRAVGSLDESLALARPYLAPGGRVVLPRGSKDADQAQGLGLDVVPYPTPGGKGRRIVAILRT